MKNDTSALDLGLAWQQHLQPNHTYLSQKNHVRISTFSKCDANLISKIVKNSEKHYFLVVRSGK